MSNTGERQEADDILQRYNLDVFTEPRGVIRIVHICLATFSVIVLRHYSGYISIDYCNKANPSTITLPIEFPYNLKSVTGKVICGNINTNITLDCDISSEAWFLFITSLISLVYAIVVATVYVIFKKDYDNNKTFAVADFSISVIVTVLGFASFTTWACGQNLLKTFTDPLFLGKNLHVCSYKHREYIHCFSIVRGSVFGLTISLISSFLNFFLWLSALWFLYKETPWYSHYEQRHQEGNNTSREKKSSQT